jgi:hypothetical protein
MRNFLSTLFAAALLTGCATLSPEKLASADCGPYPENYEEIVKAWMQQTLKDPYTAHLQVKSPPAKGAFERGLAYGGGYLFGWKVYANINAKNSYGGYTGNKLWYILIRDGAVFHAEEMLSGKQPFMTY